MPQGPAASLHACPNGTRTRITGGRRRYRWGGGTGDWGEVDDLAGGGTSRKCPRGGVREEGQQKQSMDEKDTMKHITLYVKL